METCKISGTTPSRGAKERSEGHERLPLTSDTNARLYRLFDNIDYTCLVIGVELLIAGLMPLIDAVQQMNVIKEVKTHVGWETAQRQDELHTLDKGGLFKGCVLRSNNIPGGLVAVLILYGLVTGIGWVATQRAISRLISVNATLFLAQHFQQSDLSPIFNFEPTMRWLRWRLTLWISSAFWLACIVCYAGVSLTAKVAFTPRSVSSTIRQVAYLSPMMGYSLHALSDLQTSPGLYATLVDLSSDKTGNGYYYPHVDGGGVYKADAGKWVSAKLNNWTVLAGWHGPPRRVLHHPSGPPEEHVSGYVDLFSSGIAFINATYVTGLGQLNSGEAQLCGARGEENEFCYDDNPYNGSLTVADHPTCGPLLRWCGDYGYCVWLGLGVGDLSVRLTWGRTQFFDESLKTAPKYSVWDAWEVQTNSSCPLELNSSIHEMTADELLPDRKRGSLNIDLIFKMLVAHTITNTSLIPGSSTTLLRERGLLGEGANCLAETAAVTADIMWTTTEADFITWEFGLAGILFLWSAVLIFAAFHFRSRVVVNLPN